MYKTVLIGFVILLISSCKDNEKIWLQEYKNTKCNWAKTEADFKKDSVINSAKYSVKLTKIQTEIKKIKGPINDEIELLNHKIGQINIKYLNESHKISEEQERVSGHNPNPKYERRLDENDNNNTREVMALENKKVLLQLQLNKNQLLQKLFSEEKEIQEQIASKTTALKEKYKTTFDSLKNKLDNQNSDFRMIIEDLDRPKKEIFKSQKEKINADPCK